MIHRVNFNYSNPKYSDNDNLMEKILVVGVVSNSGHRLFKDILRLKSALVDFKELDFFVVESNSKNSTIKVLNKLCSQIANFSFVSLGDLNILDRIERIRYCRNIYVDFIRKIPIENLPNFIIVADLDGINSSISKNGIRSCFKRNDWDVVLANQIIGYYDIYALRHPIWQPIDCFEELTYYKRSINTEKFSRFKFVQKIYLFFEYDNARKKAIYSKMIKLRKKSDWISVSSGFGGLGIYKPQLFLDYNYSKSSSEHRFTESEHVDFCKNIIDAGGKIFINPTLINSVWNTHNINKFFIVRIIRQYLTKSKTITRISRFMRTK